MTLRDPIRRRAPPRVAVAASAAMLLALQAGIELAMGRPPICTCGHVALWHGAVDAGNSQHLFDWYSLSHVVHGVLFYAFARVALPRRSIRERLLLALAIEIAWEIAENTPFVIDRYRMTATALGYTGDSVVNSLADVAAMTAGFAAAAQLPAWAAALLVLALEAAAWFAIHDNLTRNVLALLATFR